MLERYQKDLSIETLLNRWNLSMKPEPRKNKESVKLVDYSCDENEDIFLSDVEESDEEELPTTCAWNLNPEVAEFVPLSSRDPSPLTLLSTEGSQEEERDKEEQEQEVFQDEKEQTEEEELQEQGIGGLLQSLRTQEGLFGPPPPGIVPPPGICLPVVTAPLTMFSPPDIVSFTPVAPPGISPLPSSIPPGFSHPSPVTPAPEPLSEPEPEPDISHLLSMFPNLSLGQLETLYMEHRGSTSSVVEALLDQQQEEEESSPSLLPTVSNTESVSEDTASSASTSDEEPNSFCISLDPMFAVSLQEQYGSPVDESLLTFLSTEELLSVPIPAHLALEIFTCWRNSLHSKLGSKPLLSSCESRPDPPPTQAEAEDSVPRTVLAPNAVEYYERQSVSAALEASLQQPVKPRPRVVLAHPKTLSGQSDREEGGLDSFIKQRDELYRKARASSRIQGVAGYYVTEARQLNKQIKDRQKEAQLELFHAANRGLPANSLDLHFLHTGEAIKRLAVFVMERQARLRPGHQEWLEIVTGKGNRSDNGKSRLRPAVTQWLEQKRLYFNEVNLGCLKILIKNT